MTTKHLRLPPERDLPPGSLEQRKEHLVSELGLPARGRGAVPRRPRWFVPAAGAATVAAIAAAVFVGVGTNGSESASAATAVLRDAAAVARAQAAPPRPGPGQYLYARSVSAYLTQSVYSQDLTFAVLVPRVREVWIGRGGGLLRESSGKPEFLSERDRRAWIEAGRPDLREPAGTTRIGAARPLDLPSDPDVLFERLEREAAGHPEGVHEQMFTLIGDALRETAVSPEQRAALYEVAARIPGVELVGRVRDPAGRPGVAVAMPSAEDGIQHTLVLDPATGALLAEEQVTLRENPWNYPAGTLVGHSTYLALAVVDALRERPRA
jgi:hypothetical protein